MLSTSLQVVYEAVLGIFVLALVTTLESTGILRAIVQDFTARNFDSLFRDLSSPDFLNTALAFMLPAVVTVIIVSVIANGFIGAAEFGSCWLAVNGSHVGLAEVLRNFVDRWKAMAWAQFLSYTITFLPIFVGYVIGLGTLVLLGASLTAVVVLAIGVIAGIVLTALFAMYFVYTPILVVSEKATGLTAIRGSIRLARRNFRITATYGAVLVFLTLLLTEGAALIPGINLPLSSLASVGILILVTPVLHLTKTMLFAQIQNMPTSEEPLFYNPFLSDIFGPFLRYSWRTFVKGLHELKRYSLNPRNYPYHLISATGLVIGWLIGTWIAGHGLTALIYQLGYQPGRINPQVSNSPPLSIGTYIFLHNWTTSLATGLSGVWFSIFPLVTLALNGVILGIVSSLVPNQTMLLAAILPHGVIEIPSFVLAGSAGIRLGVEFVRFRRNSLWFEEFQAAFRQTVYLLIGLALLFLMAGLIEGNVTPIIMRMAGWT